MWEVGQTDERDRKFKKITIEADHLENDHHTDLAQDTHITNPAT
jgi:hypothetical protein